jgi:hypothetical protein
MRRTFFVEKKAQEEYAPHGVITTNRTSHGLHNKVVSKLNVRSIDNMKLRRCWSALTAGICLSFTLLITLADSPSLDQASLKYQDRGDRFEGVDKGFPTSAKAELISAVVNYNETLTQIPSQYKLKFYLSKTVPVFVTVREIDNKYNYWMDKLKPRSGWHQGFDNEFLWPTQAVIQQKQIRLEELGAVAQLGSSDSSVDMDVAPVILFSTGLPARIDGYSFTFTVSRKADVTFSFAKDVDNSPLLATQSQEIPARRPRTVSWNAAKITEGRYKLSIKVIYSDNGKQVDQTIRFYHRPTIK